MSHDHNTFSNDLSNDQVHSQAPSSQENYSPKTSYNIYYDVQITGPDKNDQICTLGIPCEIRNNTKFRSFSYVDTCHVSDDLCVIQIPLCEAYEYFKLISEEYPSSLMLTFNSNYSDFFILEAANNITASKNRPFPEAISYKDTYNTSQEYLANNWHHTSDHTCNYYNYYYYNIVNLYWLDLHTVPALKAPEITKKYKDASLFILRARMGYISNTAIKSCDYQATYPIENHKFITPFALSCVENIISLKFLHQTREVQEYIAAIQHLNKEFKLTTHIPITTYALTEIHAQLLPISKCTTAQLSHEDVATKLSQYLLEGSELKKHLLLKTQHTISFLGLEIKTQDGNLYYLNKQPQDSNALKAKSCKIFVGFANLYLACYTGPVHNCFAPKTKEKLHKLIQKYMDPKTCTTEANAYKLVLDSIHNRVCKHVSDSNILNIRNTDINKINHDATTYQIAQTAKLCLLEWLIKNFDAEIQAINKSGIVFNIDPDQYLTKFKEQVAEFKIGFLKFTKIKYFVVQQTYIKDLDNYIYIAEKEKQSILKGSWISTDKFRESLRLSRICYNIVNSAEIIKAHLHQDACSHLLPLRVIGYKNFNGKKLHWQHIEYINPNWYLDKSTPLGMPVFWGFNINPMFKEEETIHIFDWVKKLHTQTTKEENSLDNTQP